MSVLTRTVTLEYDTEGKREVMTTTAVMSISTELSEENHRDGHRGLRPTIRVSPDRDQSARLAIHFIETHNRHLGQVERLR